MPLCTRGVACIACIFILVVLCMAAGCSSSQAPVPATAAPGAPVVSTGNTITMKNFAFEPSVLTINSGSAITWVNQDSATHTVVSDTGAPEGFSSDKLSTGGTFTHTFTTPGTYAYHCSIHPSMKATIIVQ